MLRVLLVGYGELASSLMLGILESKHKLVGIVRWETTKENKTLSFLKDIFWPDQFSSLIRSYRINEIKTNSINSKEFYKTALKLQPDIILIGSWGEKFKKHMIILPKVACVNCHPSLLPRYRGSNPYFSTISNGETKSGITFHLVDENLDTGPILLQREVDISNNDTGGSLRTKCSFEARQSIKKLLDGLENAKFLPQKQNEALASYFSGIKSEDANIDWNNPPEIIYNQIRALNPWVSGYTRHKNQILTVSESKIIDLKNLASKPGKILARKASNLIVSTSDPYKAIMLKNTGVYGFLSSLWSFYYINNYIKPGDYLEEL